MYFVLFCDFNYKTKTGLEAFDWHAGAWRILEETERDDEAILFVGELLCQMYPSTSLPALCHRVCVNVNSLSRISCPIELLPQPSKEACTLLSSLGNGLVSVNF